MMTQPQSRVSRSTQPYLGEDVRKVKCDAFSNSASIRFSTVSGQVYKISPGATAVATMQGAIQAGGSIVATLDIYQDFSVFRSGVYIKSSDDFLGMHAVAVLGWGTHNTVRYWIFANSWGTTWGEDGYGKIRLGTNEVNFEQESMYTMPMLPTECASAPQCKNGGNWDKACGCVCPTTAFWSGPTCETCSAVCRNGGVLNTSSCLCMCPQGYYGPNCDQFVLFQWVKLAYPTASAKLSWNLESYSAGSEFVRYANVLGAAGNPVITGTNVKITAQSGSTVISIDTRAYVPGYPKGFFYAFHKNLGVNEFGSTKGMEVVDLPGAFCTDAAPQCLSGGNVPETSAMNLCANAYTKSPLAPAASSAPVELTPKLTPLPSPVPTRQPTSAPAAPATAAPVVPATAAPTTSRPTTSPTLTPTNTPTRAPTRAPTTLAPTAPPTQAPTAPVVPATAAPTTSPTLSPTNTPTRAPTTLAPTAPPTHAPTAPPVAPTATPTRAPTTRAPTAAPVQVPAAQPAATSAPTTLAPTAAPTVAPTAWTAVPSSASAAPTQLPTVASTMAPSVGPTGTPSFSPSLLPSAAPTFVPSRAPTLPSTFAPTAPPTAASTFAPTRAPTTPTAAVTSAPSFAPTTLAPSCVDKDTTNCPLWAGVGECAKNPAYMRTNCPKSCSVCTGGAFANALAFRLA